MPHIFIEYSKNLETKLDLQALTNAAHEALAAQGIDKSRIKTRAICCDYTAVGDKGADGQMLHGTLLLLEGRDIPTKKLYGDAIYGKLLEFATEGCAVTLEIRDMVKDTYYM